MNRNDALTGVLVADAAALGLHWIYDQEQIKAIAKSGDVLFRQPDVSVYKDQRGYFAHAARRSGELSHYGESARIVGQLAANNEYTTAQHRQRFFDSFGPCGHYVGYADKPTKILISRIITEGEDIAEASGMDDNQMPAIAVVPGLFAFEHSAEAINSAINVISTHVDVIAGAKAVRECLDYIAEGQTLTEALNLSANAMEGDVGELMRKALLIKEYNPVEISKNFGLACYVEHSLPVVWYLLNHASDFESIVRDNISCGGDSCGRSMALGAIAGLAFGVPDALINRMSGGRVPINL